MFVPWNWLREQKCDFTLIYGSVYKLYIGKIPLETNTFSGKKEGKKIFIFRFINIQAQLLLKMCIYSYEQ